MLARSEAALGNRWWIVVLLFLAALINYIDRGNLSIAAVPIMAHFNRSPAAMGFLFSAFYWSYSLLQIPAGCLVDRVGLRRIYGIAFLIWSLASAAVGLASSFTQLVILRMILGIGEASATPASLAYIQRQFTTREQGLPTGIVTSGMIAGPAVGALVGSFLLVRFGWRMLFIFTGLGSCMWLWPWFRSASSGTPVIATTSSANLERISPLRLFRLRPAWAITMGAFFYSYYWYFCITWLPSYLIISRHFSYLRMGSFTSLPFAVLAVISPLAGWSADQIIERGRSPLSVRKLFVSLGFLLGSSIAFLPMTGSPGLVLLTLVCSVGGIGLASANYWALTEALAPPSLAGRVLGYQNTIGNLAGIAAPIVTGSLVAGTQTFALAILFAAAALWIAAAAFAVLLRQDDFDRVRAEFPT